MYARICDDFGFDKAKDIESAQWLSTQLGERGVRALEVVKRDFPQSVLVCGGGPRLADEISAITAKGYVIAADSATTVLMDANMHVDMIVTDLDGIVEDQIDANGQGTVVFVHAHGDNMKALARYTGQFKGPLVGTCQCAPPSGIFNFGGFTDGDRAACIAAELGARRLFLAGFDFENPSDKEGKSRDVKLRKLKWAKVILDTLAQEGTRLLPAGEEFG
jgi:uncharacterized Rossmann fold enzyme